jgi:hypothetical protein
MHVLPAAHTLVSICTTLSAEWFVVLHTIATAILIHCVGTRVSLVTEARDPCEFIFRHTV